MNNDEPKFLNEIMVKVECHRECNRGKLVDYLGKQHECPGCNGKGFNTENLEDAILELVKGSLRDMLKDVIGG